MSVLLTGFAPFGGQRLNASGEVARALAGAVGATAVLPVTYRSATAVLLDALQRTRPAAVVVLGEFAGTPAILLERVARNRSSSPAPDEEGVVARDSAVVPGGPDAYASRLPLDAIAARLDAAGIPVQASDDAGGYVCNHVFYGLMHELATSGRELAGGLVHVPCLPEQAASPHAPAMALETQVRAVEELLAALPA